MYKKDALSFTKVELLKDMKCVLSKLEKHSTKVSGVYILYDKEDTIIYVGQTSNLYSRLQNHHNKRFSYFKFIPEKNSVKKRFIEACFIEQYHPIWNMYQPYNNLINYHSPKKYRSEWIGINALSRRREISKILKEHPKITSRQLQKIFLKKYKVIINHNTFNADLHKIRRI